MRSLVLAATAIVVGCGGDPQPSGPKILNPDAAAACRSMERALESSMGRCLYSDAAREQFRSKWERDFGDDCGNVVHIRDENELSECISWIVDSNCHDVELAAETDTMPDMCRGQLITPDTGKL